jgi:RNA polymerase sigma factor (TIGR02999 family)
MLPKDPVDRAPGEVTSLLQAWGQGDANAGERLFPLVYDELRRQARRYLRGERAGHTLEPTALAHEAYLRLAGRERAWADRAHFFAVASRAMRQVLVDHARARLRQKRGAGQGALGTLDDVPAAATGPEWLLDLDRILARLRARDEQLVSVFECRFFGGFSEAETAEALGLSLRSVQRAFMRARAWLRTELGAAAEEPHGD